MGWALLKAEGTTTGRFSSIFSRGAKESSQISLFGGSIYTSDASSDSLIGEQQLAGAASAISIAGSEITINGQTIIPGGSITVSGSPVAYPGMGPAVLVGTRIQLFSYAAITSAKKPVMASYENTYTGGASSDFVITGQSLAPDNIITVFGTPILSAVGDGHVMVGASIESVSLGGFFISGMRSRPTNKSVVEFAGGASLSLAASKIVAI